MLGFNWAFDWIERDRHREKRRDAVHQLAAGRSATGPFSLPVFRPPAHDEHAPGRVLA